MPVTVLDMIVIGVVVLSALLAAVRGFTREVLAIASWVAAAVAAWSFHPMLMPYIRQHVKNDTIVLVAAIAVIFLLTLIVVSLITARISDFVLDSRIGALDRTLGLAFGAARGLLLAVVGYLFFTTLVPDGRQPAWARDAKSKPLLEATGKSLLAVLPQDIDTSFLRTLTPPRGDPSEPPAEAERPAERRTEAPARPPATLDQQGLQRAIDTVQRPQQPQRP
jgi:membrane protein required for colicin V production